MEINLILSVHLNYSARRDFIVVFVYLLLFFSFKERFHCYFYLFIFCFYYSALNVYFFMIQGEILLLFLFYFFVFIIQFPVKYIKEIFFQLIISKEKKYCDYEYFALFFIHLLIYFHHSNLNEV